MLSSDPDPAPSPGRDTIARSMSRYKGKRPGTPNCTPPVPKVDPIHTQHARTASQPAVSPPGLSLQSDTPTIQSGENIRDRDPTSKAARSRGPSSPPASHIRVGDTIRKAEKQLGGAQTDHPELAPRSALNSQPTSNWQAKDEARGTLSQAHRPQTRQRDVIPNFHENGSPNPRNGPRDRDVEKIDRLEVPPDSGRRPSDNHPQVRHLRVESQRKIEKLDKSRIYGPKPVPLPKKSFSERIAEHLSKYQPSGRSNSKTDLKRLISTPIAMPEGGEITTPSFDAPISAVNAGERRVIVQCKDSLISLPVTPTTTPLDIIRASATDKLYVVNVKNSVLLESFKKVGLERPLRKYEHIRDVLNSWDNDAQNTLTIVPSSTDGYDDDLEAKNVPKEQPGETTVYMYYSQKPGRWDKRWVTLRSDGQVVVRKTGKDSTNICHLSDFDIYVPTPRQLGKKIKPPKKICFAVKSQQKSSMFLSTANFVHFFSTSDKVSATTWYKAVQQWRSWYLVNIMGEGQNAATAAAAAAAAAKVMPSDKFRNGKDLPTSNGVFGESYEKSLAAYDPSVRDRKDAVKSEAPQSGGGRQQNTSTAQENGHLATNSRKPKSGPPISFPKNFLQNSNSEIPTNRAQGPAGRNNEAEPFSTNGLLGRSYSQRQRTHQRDGLGDSGSHPGPNYIGTSPPQAQEEGGGGGGGGGGLKRASSQRQKPKPLIDLTPQYQEPPQHSKKGRGVIPQQIPAGGLVDIATSPEIAIPIPPNRTWRRPGTSSGEHTTMRSPPVHGGDFKRDFLSNS